MTTGCVMTNATAERNRPWRKGDRETQGDEQEMESGSWALRTLHTFTQESFRGTLALHMKTRASPETPTAWNDLEIPGP